MDIGQNKKKKLKRKNKASQESSKSKIAGKQVN